MAGSVDKCWREVHEVMMQSQLQVGRLGIQIEMSLLQKNWIYDCRVNRGTINVEM
jgi:hypothetical protein